MSKIKKVVMVSGGRTSTEALRRVLMTTDPGEVVALFADTKSEHRDLYRYMEDVDEKLHPVVAVADGRNIWQVFRDVRFIGNSRVDVCSRILKREPCLKWVRQYAPDAKIVLGLDWSEPHRIETSRARWANDGFEAEYPLAEPPYLFEGEYSAQIKKLGIELPLLYSLGFSHNNCGGGCVKAGQGQWAQLLRVDPVFYGWHEEEEQITRAHIGKDVAILRDSRGGTVKPLTLRDFRLRTEAGAPPQDELFVCNCMA